MGNCGKYWLAKVRFEWRILRGGLDGDIGVRGGSELRGTAGVWRFERRIERIKSFCEGRRVEFNEYLKNEHGYGIETIVAVLMGLFRAFSIFGICGNGVKVTNSL